MITAQIASVPERIDCLKTTVTSIIDQVDLLFVALNGHDDVPEFLTNNRKIVYIIMDNSLGDAAKFYDADQRKGYVFTCDDDIAYPQGYVRYMINGIEQYGGIVTLLGKKYDARPISSYRSGYTYIARSLSHVATPSVVHVGGTGVMAFHTDNFNIPMEYFEEKNMADLWVAKAAAEQGVTITALPHPKNYIAHSHYSKRIWVSERDNDGYQTNVINSFLK